MTISIQYPFIPGNDICDGTVHRIKPIKLNRVIGLPLLVLEYHDYEVNTQCITIILVDAQGFHKIPLLGYDELFEILDNDEWLEPIDIGILPDTIAANKPVKDWPELIAVNSLGSKPRNNPPILRASAGGKKPSWLKHYLTIRRVITLYIDGETVLYGTNDNTGNIVFRAISYDLLCRLFDEYDIIWRKIDGTLVKNKTEINLILRICERQLSNESVYYQIREIGLEEQNGKLLPPYYGRYIHRYYVDIAPRW